MYLGASVLATDVCLFGLQHRALPGAREETKWSDERILIFTH